MFEVNFDVDLEKLKLVLQPKFTNYVNNLLSGEANIKTAVTELNRTLEESFVESKLKRSEKKECSDWENYMEKNYGIESIGPVIYLEQKIMKNPKTKKPLSTFMHMEMSQLLMT